MQPTPDEVRAALDRVLASGSFAGTSRLSRFLRFVVERSLAGEAERLKEYVIGVEVFDRDERYDPRIDSIVRVEAGRLRAKLDEYYRGAGAGDAVAIVLEKGRYAPAFVRRAEAPRDPGVASVTAGPTGPSTRSGTDGAPSASSGRMAPPANPSAGSSATPSLATRRRFVIAGSLAVIVAALVVGAASWRGARRAAAAPATTVVAVLPFTTYSTDADARMLATRLTDGVTAELVRLGRFSVVASSAARPFADSRAPPHDIARDLHADLLLEARVNSQDGALKVDAIVIDGARDRKLWFETLTGDPASLDELARRVAMAAAGSPLSAPP
jgi:TolB-like protein